MAGHSCKGPRRGQKSFDGGFKRLLRQGSHGEELVLKLGKLLVKVDAGHRQGPPDSETG